MKRFVSFMLVVVLSMFTASASASAAFEYEFYCVKNNKKYQTLCYCPIEGRNTDGSVMLSSTFDVEDVVYADPYDGGRSLSVTFSVKKWTDGTTTLEVKNVTVLNAEGAAAIGIVDAMDDAIAYLQSIGAYAQMFVEKKFYKNFTRVWQIEVKGIVLYLVHANNCPWDTGWAYELKGQAKKKSSGSGSGDTAPGTTPGEGPTDGGSDTTPGTTPGEGPTDGGSDTTPGTTGGTGPTEPGTTGGVGPQ